MYKFGDKSWKQVSCQQTAMSDSSKWTKRQANEEFTPNQRGCGQWIWVRSLQNKTPRFVPLGHMLNKSNKHWKAGKQASNNRSPSSTAHAHLIHPLLLNQALAEARAQDTLSLWQTVFQPSAVCKHQWYWDPFWRFQLIKALLPQNVFDGMEWLSHKENPR